jgi:hypothetical protein
MIKVYGRTIISILSFCGLGVLVLAGWWGTRDPLANPLPLFFWTLLWTGLVILQGLIGNLWSWLNCQRRSKTRPLGRSKTGPVWARRRPLAKRAFP